MLPACGFLDFDQTANTSSQDDSFNALVEEKMVLPTKDIIEQAFAIIASLETAPTLSFEDKQSLRAITKVLIQSRNSEEAVKVLSFIRNHLIFQDDTQLLAESNENLGRIHLNKLEYEVADFYLFQAYELYLGIKDYSKVRYQELI